MSTIQKSAMLKVELAVGEYQNTWNVYVYPVINRQDTMVKDKKKKEDSFDLRDAENTVCRHLVTPDCVEKTIEGSYIPVFWSPVHFPSSKPCGAIIDTKHPIFADFPTEEYPDYQWKTLFDTAKGTYLNDFPGAKSIVEFVPNFVDCSETSPLFEYEKEGRKYLYCGFDLEQDRPEVKQLKYSIMKYLKEISVITFVVN